VEPSVKSEPVPEKQDGPVTVVVAKNYQDIVMDSDKDVLLEFYAPWCGHCKALAPKYDELAGMFKPFSDRITIAKVDATLNDVPDEIQGFPTIKLFKAGSKDSPVDYTGSRTVEDLANFLRDSGTHHIDAAGSADEEAKTEGVIETDHMPNQAPAATAKSGASKAAESVTSGVAGKAASVAKEAAEAVKTVLVDGDEGGAEDHDEL